MLMFFLNIYKLMLISIEFIFVKIILNYLLKNHFKLSFEKNIFLIIVIIINIFLYLSLYF